MFALIAATLTLALLSERTTRRRRGAHPAKTTIPVGTLLYHGTGAEERFELEGDAPDGPAWFSSSPEVARYFSRWNSGPVPRIVEYRCLYDIEVFLIEEGLTDLMVAAYDYEDADDLYDGNMEEIVEELCSRGEGWVIPDNYPEGDDTLLCDPESWLETTGRVLLL